MPDTLSLLDRLRIERVVWVLDQRLYDLPRKTRIAKRREVRENLQVAAADVGVGHALRNLGNTHRLAAEYRAAEFGDDPRPAWLAAGCSSLPRSCSSPRSSPRPPMLSAPASKPRTLLRPARSPGAVSAMCKTR